MDISNNDRDETNDNNQVVLSALISTWSVILLPLFIYCRLRIVRKIGQSNPK